VSETDTEELIRVIDEAFADVTIPPDDGLLMDPSATHLEGQKIKAAFAGRDWREIQLDTLNEHRSALAFLSAAAYAAYLPAFLKASVTDYDRVDIIPNDVIATLTAPSELDLDRIKAEAEASGRLQPLTDGEWAQVLDSLSAGYHEGILERVFLERAAQFDPRQKRIIRRFLEFMRDAHGADFPDGAPQVALARYWGRY